VEDAPRILSLELLTAAPLAAMKDFYHGKLGLRVTDERDDRLTIAGGATPITFVRPTTEPASPFYHFAFNIPQNKIRAARDWQRQRGELLPIPPALRDPAYPDDVVNYSHWNAHSVFFFDPAGNVVEYIARHDLTNDAPGNFTSEDILYASEIAFVTDDVAATSAKLKEVAGAEQYRGASDQFAALGDERGLLLVMKRGRVISFDAPQKKAVDVFRTSARVRGARRATHHFAEFPYELVVER
jgi:catechol 2,3-dioxygenase-like lactoylglutathione lyase family enzyme